MVLNYFYQSILLYCFYIPKKVLKISAEDAKYIDPNLIANLTMVDGSTVFVRGNEEDFVEEIQEGGEQYDQQSQQQVKQPA